MKSTHRPRGSVVLLVLCLVAVLGIILAGFLAVSNQAMKASNRTHHKDVSLKLAEIGLERTLDAFVSGSFDSPWTISDTTAKINFTVADPNYATSGITTTVNVRVDNYDLFWRGNEHNISTKYRRNEMVGYQPFFGAFRWYSADNANPAGYPSTSSDWSALTSETFWEWDSAAVYNRGDVVRRSSRWYRSLKTNSNKVPPNPAYWDTNPLARYQWTAGAYNLNDVVYYRATWYRCKQAHNSSRFPDEISSDYWVSASTTTWDKDTAYNAGSWVSFGQAWYRCVAGNTGRSPTNVSYWVTDAPVVYAEGLVTTANGNTIRTQLRAMIEPIPLFPNAIAATGAATFYSGGTIDSYDSTKGSYDPVTPGDSAVVAGGNTAGAAVVLSNVKVRGYLAAPPSASAPYAPWYSVGGTAALTKTGGAVTSPHPSAANVDRDRTIRSPFIPNPDILTPNTINADTSVTLSDATKTLGNSADATWRTYYTAGDLSLTGSNTYTIDGPVRLIVRGKLSLSNNSAILFSSSATAKLEIYVAGKIELTTQAGIDNKTRLPKNLIIYCTSASFDSYIVGPTTAFYGVMYFSNPNSRLALYGTVPEFYGAISAGTFTSYASPVLHYDTSLRYTTFPGAQPTYRFSDWRELTDINEQVTLP